MENTNVKLTLKFPKLEKALTKNKDLKDDDPRKGIIVLNNNAIVINDDFCLVIELMDYFAIDCGIEDELELQELKKILFYMDEKIFTKEYWEELTKGATMRMNGDAIYIETPKYAKDLHYKHMEANLLFPLSMLKSVSESRQSLISAVALPFGSLKQIYDTLPNDFKGDHIIFEFADQTRPTKFTFRNRKHVYGYILPHYDAAQEGFKFETMHAFVEDEYIKSITVELETAKKASLAPPPPSRNPEPLEPNQKEMFGPDINESHE